MKGIARTTIRDVAELAGVSIATVSRVLNRSTHVADETNAQVQQAIDQLQYRPDRTARSLAGRWIGPVVVAIPTFTTPFHSELLKGMRTALGTEDPELMIWDLDWRDPYAALRRMLARGKVSGLLLVGVRMDKRVMDELRSFHAPVVLIGDRADDFDSFYWDDVAGARLAVGHLIRRGHRRIGMIRSATDSLMQALRVEGYRQTLQCAGLEWDPTLVTAGSTPKHAGFSEEAGYEAMKKLLLLPQPTTAVFASSDAQAIGARKAIEDAGMQSPDDVALVGYDDVKVSRYVGLTSIDQSAQRVGSQAAHLLIRRMEGSPAGARVSERVLPRLRVRASS